jgi:hypothetical protein
MGFVAMLLVVSRTSVFFSTRFAMLFSARFMAFSVVRFALVHFPALRAKDCLLESKTYVLVSSSPKEVAVCDRLTSVRLSAKVVFSAGFVAVAIVSRVLSTGFVTLSTRLSAMFIAPRLVFAGLFYAFVFLNKRVNTTLFFS